MLARLLALFLLLPTTGLAVDLQAPSSAELCGDCHRAIPEGWKQSAHATAMESRLLQDALRVAEADFGTRARAVCLSCHAPIAVKTGVLALTRKVSREEVTCDYCHSIQDVTLATGGNPNARVEFTLVKSGPTRDLALPAHGIQFSPVHISSLACVSCHEYRNSLGFQVLTAHSEWENSSHGKEQVGCQSCHMYSVKGNVVDPRVQRSADTVNLHEMPGSHSVQQLNKAIRAQLSIVREDKQLRVVVKLVNRGHHVPRGSPLRQVRMKLRAASYDGGHLREERVYRRTVADKDGNVPDREPSALIRGAQVLGDTRVPPNETRIETFSFPIPRQT